MPYMAFMSRAELWRGPQRTPPKPRSGVPADARAAIRGRPISGLIKVFMRLLIESKYGGCSMNVMAALLRGVAFSIPLKSP